MNAAAAQTPLLTHCGVDMWSYEAPGVYDGTAFWVCPECGAWMHRFPIGSSHRLAAHRFSVEHRDQFPAAKEIVEVAR